MRLTAIGLAVIALASVVAGLHLRHADELLIAQARIAHGRGKLTGLQVFKTADNAFVCGTMTDRGISRPFIYNARTQKICLADCVASDC